MTLVSAAHLRAAMLVALVTLGVAGSAAAQEARGTITGTVRDASKGVVPGASVTLTNVAMGTAVTVTSRTGALPGVVPAPRGLHGRGRALRLQEVLREVEVRVDDRLELEIRSKSAATVETVTVTADTPLLETTNASLGQVVDSRRISELPTPHGDPYALIGLADGVSYTGSARLDRPFEPTHIVGYAMDGTRGNRSDLTIDGVPSTATANAGEVIASYVPPADTLQEFKVQTATFDAAFGNTEGGVTNLSTKSGTNSLRGTA